MEDQPSRAETLPTLYRAVLDGVTELERRGDRARALRVRARATRSYAVWDAKAERRLRSVLDELRRSLDAPTTRERVRRPGLGGRLRASARASIRERAPSG